MTLWRGPAERVADIDDQFPAGRGHCHHFVVFSEKKRDEMRYMRRSPVKHVLVLEAAIMGRHRFAADYHLVETTFNC